VFSVSDAQARLPSLLRRLDAFAIAKHGKTVGFYVSREKLAAILETLEILGNADAMKAIHDFEAGRSEFVEIEDVAP
jgi:hypothetical protein